MRVLRDSWCFCNGGARSERMKSAIFSGKASAMARICGGGIGFLIHRNLLLTSHANIPSVSAAAAADIRLQNGISVTLYPHRFFITSPVLDLTIVGLDAFDGDSNASVQQLHYLKACPNPNLEFGSTVYLLGCTEKQDLTVGQAKVIIATDNLIKLSTDGVTWSPGSAGFDVNGNLAFMVCYPMKLATSPHTKSPPTSSSTSSWKKNFPMQFGIPIPIICDWLNQHWEGNLDELSKPKLPLIRLMSSGHRSEHSCASFTMRRVFKSSEGEVDGIPTPSNIISRSIEQPGSSCPVLDTFGDDILNGDLHCKNHVQGIPTPEIYESPRLTSDLARKNETTRIQLLDINFPPKIAKAALSPWPSRKMQPNCDQNWAKNCSPKQETEGRSVIGQSSPIGEAESTGSVNRVLSRVQSCSPPVGLSEVPHEYSSEGETTMYSAETAESRNYPSPRMFHQVGRSQSCVNYNRWAPVQKTSVARGAKLEKHLSFTQGRKVHSQGANSQRSNDYFSPTVSSIMKKRNNLEQLNRPRQIAVSSSPRFLSDLAHPTLKGSSFRNSNLHR